MPGWRRIHVTSFDSTQGDDELPLLVAEVGERHDGAARPAARGRSRASMSSGSPCAPRREGGRRQQAVEPEGQLGAVGGREERVEVEHAELADRRRLHLADQAGEVEVLARRPRRGARGWRAGCARGWPADRPRCRRARAGPRRCPRSPRRSSRGRCPRAGAAGADHVERDAAGRPGRVDGDVGGVAQRLDPGAVDAPARQARPSTLSATAAASPPSTHGAKRRRRGRGR